MWCLYLRTCLLIVLVGCCTTTIYNSNVCQRVETYTKWVQKTVTVTYRRKHFWTWYNGQRNEVRDVPETAYTYKDYCCPGYTGSPYNCRPICSGGCPEHGHCTAPNQCTCDDGYSGSDCKPICHLVECGEHSFCAEPETCRCIEGYSISPPDAACLPVCESGCGAHRYCQAPNQCECNEGYKEQDGECRPICATVCPPNSSCVLPGECRCDAGYEINEEGGCQPVCSRGCPEHSSCLAPELCTCNHGYAERQPSQCEAVCPSSCGEYARCVAPSVCECYPGYEWMPADGLCAPKCSRECAHGYCFAPEVCACGPGYLMGPNNSCEPQCGKSCVHGNCTAPETCECEPGYRFATDSRHICAPICEPECQNGSCMAPQVCICHLGHEPVDPGSGSGSGFGFACKPSCQSNCVNGNCVAPDQCSCKEGYVPADGSNSTVCQPVCSRGCNGANSVCTAPELCECQPGYERTADGDCQLASTTDWVTSASTADGSTSDYSTSRWGNFSSLPVTSTDAAPDQLHQPSCASDCGCWHKVNELTDVVGVKCIHICMDDYDRPCLDLKQCICELPSGQLLCQVDEQPAERLVCSLKLTPKVTDKPTGEMALNTSKRAASAANWPAVLAWCAGTCLLLLLLLVATHFYLKHRRQRVNELNIINYEADL